MKEEIKRIISEYSECFENIHRLKSLLMDLFPEDKMTRNLLLISVEEKIYEDIKNSEYIDALFANSLKLRLSSASGCSMEKAEEIVLLWLYAFDRKYDYRFLSQYTFIEPLNYGETYNKDEIDLLEKVIISGEVGSIGECFFQDSNTLKEVIILDGVEEICDNAFYRCCGIEKIVLPDSVKKIGNNAFDGCINLKEIVINNVRTIGEYCFYGCKSLSSVIMGDRLEIIGGYAFYNCSSLEIFKFPKGIRIINEWSFYDCVNLKSIILNEGLEYIGECAFSGCESLLDIKFPKCLNTIEDNAFLGCGELSDIVIPGKTVNIGDCVFEGTKWYANEIKDKDYFEINGTLLYVREDIDNFDFLQDVKVIGSNVFSNCINMHSLIIPNNIKKIRASFAGCVNLQSVVISENVLEVGEMAFSGCDKLRNVLISEGVMEIGENAFEECDSLEHIIFPQSIVKIKKEAFCNCKKLERLDFADKKIIVVEDEITDTEMDDNTIYINKNAFKDCTIIKNKPEYQFLFSVSKK